MSNGISAALRHAGLIAVLSACAVSSVMGGEYEGEDGAAVARMLPATKVSLQQAIGAAATTGQPLSAKYEMDEGKFQLSVYTAKNDTYSEVLVDQKTGKVAKSERLAGDEDLAHAEEQAEAMRSARSSLKSAIDKAEREAGGRAVSVMPAMSEGHAKAVVTVLKGGQYKQVTEPLE